MPSGTPARRGRACVPGVKSPTSRTSESEKNHRAHLGTYSPKGTRRILSYLLMPPSGVTAKAEFEYPAGDTSATELSTTDAPVRRANS